MIRGEFLDKTEEQLNSFSDSCDDEYDGTEYFRKKCVKAGFYLKQVYPVYHQGWELDEWGAIATKDGKTYRLETDHGSLVYEEIKEGFPIVNAIKTLFFGDVEE